jgi:hypothetical protein
MSNVKSDLHHAGLISEMGRLNKARTPSTSKMPSRDINIVQAPGINDTAA